MANTGGTPAPGGPSKTPSPQAPNRARAGVQALGGPRTEPRYYNRASGKMETRGQMQAYRRTPTTGGGHPAKAAPAKAAAPKAAQPKSWVEMKPSELLNFAKGQVESQVNSERQPFEQRAKELGNQEQASTTRLAGYGQSTDQEIAGIQKGAESSAKTFQNEAAEHAIKAQNEINTSGQNAQTSNPQVAQQLAEERANTAAIGQAGQNRATQLGQGEASFMGNLRAAAAQRATEGQANLASRFATLKGTNEGQENKVLTRKPGEISKLFQNLLGQQEKFTLAKEATGVKVGELNRKNSETASKEQATRTKEGNETSKAQSSAQTAAANAAYKVASVQQKGEMDTANVKDKEGKLKLGFEKLYNKAPNSTQTKGMSELGGAYNSIERLRSEGVSYQEIRNALAKGGERVTVKVPSKEGVTKKSVIEKLPKVTNQLLITAAEEVWKYHKVSPRTKVMLAHAGYMSDGLSEALMG